MKIADVLKTIKNKLFFLKKKPVEVLPPEKEDTTIRIALNVTLDTVTQVPYEVEFTALQLRIIRVSKWQCKKQHRRYTMVLLNEIIRSFQDKLFQKQLSKLNIVFINNMAKIRNGLVMNKWIHSLIKQSKMTIKLDEYNLMQSINRLFLIQLSMIFDLIFLDIIQLAVKSSRIVDVRFIAARLPYTLSQIVTDNTIYHLWFTYVNLSSLSMFYVLLRLSASVDESVFQLIKLKVVVAYTPGSFLKI